MEKLTTGTRRNHWLAQTPRDHWWEVDNEVWHNQIYTENKYWPQLQAQYPQYANELISNCLSFERYYPAGIPKK